MHPGFPAPTLISQGQLSHGLFARGAGRGRLLIHLLARRKKAAAERVELPENVAPFIASKVKTNIASSREA